MSISILSRAKTVLAFGCLALLLNACSTLAPVLVEQKSCVVDPTLLALAEDKLRGRERLPEGKQDILVEEVLNLWSEDRGHAATKDRAYQDLVRQIMANCLTSSK